MRRILILRIIVIFGSILLTSQLLIARELTDREKKIISDAIREKLRNPESARFKWPDFMGEHPEAYCGLVNSKNTYGGYTGDCPFMVTLLWHEGSVQVFIILGIGTADWESDRSKPILTLCEKDGYHLLRLRRSRK